MKIKIVKTYFSNNIFLKKIILIVFTYFSILLIFIVSDFLPNTPLIIEGEPAREDIMAKTNGEYEDALKTEKLRDMAEKNAGLVYYIDPKISPAVRTKIHRIFVKIKEAQVNKNLTSNENKINWLKEQLKDVTDQKLPYYTMETLLETDNKSLELIEYTTNLLVKYILNLNITQANMQDALKISEKKSSELPFSEKYLKTINEISKTVLLPNCFIDVEETQKIKSLASKQIKPVRVSVRAGEVIIERGHIVEHSQIVILKQLGMLKKDLSIKKLTGLSLITGFFLFFLGLYVYKMNNKELYNLKNLLFFSIIIISHLILSRLLFKFSGYFVCIPALSMFMAILFDYNLAIAFSIVITMIFAMFPGNQMSFVIVAITGSIISTFCVCRITKRFDLTIAGFTVGLTNFVTILAFSLMDYKSIMVMAENIGYGFASGILSGILVLGLLPVFEKYFDFTPQIRLLELANQQEPLLQKLLMEAPGTFQHSLIVSNLSEKVAQTLGVNALLTKVGALYHDIGKIKRPAFFVENQLGENPHDKMSPSLSTLIIHSHVKDGLELARKYKLPEAIKNFIPQHQGTNIAAYFYHKAKHSDHGDSIKEVDFRYPGPKPQTKEAAIIMISDSVEAAARTLDKPTPSRIQGMIKKIITKCLEDGQFDECALSFKDLSVMTDVLTQALITMYHKRIEYPDDEKNKQISNNGQSDFITRKMELKEGKEANKI